MNDFCYELGRAVAACKGDNLEFVKVLEVGQVAGVGYAFGSNGERDMLIGAFDEFKRRAAIDRKFLEQQLAAAVAAREELEKKIEGRFAATTASRVATAIDKEVGGFPYRKPKKRKVKK